DRQSLEGRGLLRVDLTRPEGIRLPPAFTDQLGLDEAEVWDLFGELVRTLRHQGALSMPEGVAADDEVFAPRLGPVYVRRESADRGRKVISWLPTSGQNRRSNYLERGLEKLGDRKSTRLNSSHVSISYAGFCCRKKRKGAYNDEGP